MVWTCWVGRACTATLERHIERGEFLREPADADADIEASAGDHIHIRRLLGEIDRVALRQNGDAGGEAQAAGVAGQKRQRGERLQRHMARIEGYLAVVGVGVGGVVVSNSSTCSGIQNEWKPASSTILAVLVMCAAVADWPAKTPCKPIFMSVSSGFV